MQDLERTPVSERANLEREAKLSAWPGFVLPDLNDALPGLTIGEPSVHPRQAPHARRVVRRTFFNQTC